MISVTDLICGRLHNGFTTNDIVENTPRWKEIMKLSIAALGLVAAVCSAPQTAYAGQCLFEETCFPSKCVGEGQLQYNCWNNVPVEKGGCNKGKWSKVLTVKNCRSSKPIDVPIEKRVRRERIKLFD